MKREVDVYKEALTFDDTTKSVIYIGEWNDALNNLNCKMDGCGIRQIEYTNNGTQYYFGSFSDNKPHGLGMMITNKKEIGSDKL